MHTRYLSRTDSVSVLSNDGLGVGLAMLGYMYVHVQSLTLGLYLSIGSIFGDSRYTKAQRTYQHRHYF